MSCVKPGTHYPRSWPLFTVDVLITEWPQIMEGNAAHTVIDGNISLDVTPVIDNVVLFYWFV